MILSRLRQIAPGGLLLLTGAITLFVVIAVLFGAQSIDLNRHDRIVANLRTLKENDAILNRQILESRFGVLPNYDPLVETLRQLRNAHRSLATGPDAIDRQGQAQIERALRQYEKVFAQRLELLEQFKSENAILGNSLRYFPGSAQTLATRAETGNARALGVLMRELLQDLLLYVVQPSKELRAKILDVSAALTRLRVQSSEMRAALENVLAHARMILGEKDEVDGLVSRLLSLPSTQRLDNLDSAYHRAYGEAVRQLTIARLFLYLSSIALLACVGYIMIRLERSRTELEHRAAEQQRLVEELSQTQDQLMQSQKMEAIGRLSGGVAHDFNNLLTVILGRSEVLASRLPPDEPSHRDIDLIKKTAGRAAGLTRQLLAFSRKQVLQPKILDLNGVVNNLTPMLQRLIGEDVQLLTLQDPGLWRVRADAAQFEQIILNLAVNARDAMPQGGRLTIETRNVELDEHFARLHPGARSGPHVVLSVSDTGTGMDEETQRKIFEPFFTTKEKGKGTGLGLSMAYGIVKQHEGYISVDSEPGRGTTFKIYLARAEEEPPETVQRAMTVGVPSRGSETVLLVEDDDGVRDLARETLQENGYAVLEADAPDKALMVAERHAGQVHILVTDVVMPQMSGRTLAERLSRLRPKMKVVYLSGYADDALGHHGVLEPGTAFLQKPFMPNDLVRKIREVLDAQEGQT